MPLVVRYSDKLKTLKFIHITSGLGLAFSIQSFIRAVLDLTVIMWSGQGLFVLFFEKVSVFKLEIKYILVTSIY